jgi:hypothetical protein
MAKETPKEKILRYSGIESKPKKIPQKPTKKNDKQKSKKK